MMGSPSGFNLNKAIVGLLRPLEARSGSMTTTTIGIQPKRRDGHQFPNLPLLRRIECSSKRHRIL